MSPWWPWHGSGDTSPSPEPGPDDRVELTESAIAALEMRAQLDQIAAIVLDAESRYGRWMPADVLLDIRLVLYPVKLRPAVPVIPGPDGARRA